MKRSIARDPLPRAYVAYLWPPVTLVGGFEDRLGINDYLNGVAAAAALVHCIVATDAKLLTIDRGFGDEAGADLWSPCRRRFHTRVCHCPR